MRILVSGSTGFLGTALVETLEGQGHSIARLVRPGHLRKALPEFAQKAFHGTRLRANSTRPEPRARTR